jgi:phage shock protein A
MNVWAKVITALRGGVNEAGEAIVDSQALRILDQEVRDASAELNESKSALADIMAREKLSQKNAKELEAQLAEHEGYALKALDKGDEVLATEVAEKMAELEDQIATEKATAEGFSENAARLRTAISQAELDIRHLKQQVDTVKAVENVQRAQAAVAERFSGSETKLRTAMESLERIKEKHALRDAKMDASSELAAEMPEASLRQKLEQAGIAPTGRQASDILDRLKEKRDATE